MTKKNKTIIVEEINQINQDINQDIIAAKDHIILQNKYRLEIKKGDDLSKMDIPERFMIALRTEKIIK